jgi:hypothetical protein
MPLWLAGRVEPVVVVKGWGVDELISLSLGLYLFVLDVQCNRLFPMLACALQLRLVA